MMPAISKTSFDATVRHSVLLERLKAGEVKRILPYLREIDRDLRVKLTREGLSRSTQGRLSGLLSEVESLIESVLGRYHTALQGELGLLAISEAKFEARSLGQAVAGWTAEVPGDAQVLAALTATPLSVRGASGGKLLEGMLSDYTRAQKEMITGAIRRGVFEGQTNAQIIQTIRGTKARRFKDGLLAISQRQAGAVVRTSVQHVSSVARAATFEANRSVVKGYEWISTLDNKTSEICQALDGRRFRVGEGPMPPAHINCRSTTVPVLDEKFDFLDKGATRASMGGPVDAKESYYSWLKKQPAEFQDAALGKTRGKLLRDGGLSAERFAKMRLSKNFEPLTLQEMQRLEPLAFKRAGIKLNPETGLPIRG